jgi:AraC-like DNA-binding protein
MRLNAVHSDLEDPALAGHAIAEIAYGRGFGDISGFNRAFRDAYGLTPTDVRAQTAAIGREAIAR